MPPHSFILANYAGFFKFRLIESNTFFLACKVSVGQARIGATLKAAIARFQSDFEALRSTAEAEISADEAVVAG